MPFIIKEGKFLIAAGAFATNIACCCVDDGPCDRPTRQVTWAGLDGDLAFLNGTHTLALIPELSSSVACRYHLIIEGFDTLPCGAGIAVTHDLTLTTFTVTGHWQTGIEEIGFFIGSYFDYYSEDNTASWNWRYCDGGIVLNDFGSNENPAPVSITLVP